MSTETAQPPRRVIVYIDGFNVYFGLRESGMKAHYWLDHHSLALSLVKTLNNAELVATKYFTSRIARLESEKPKRERPQVSLESLQAEYSAKLDTLSFDAKVRLLRRLDLQLIWDGQNLLTPIM